MKSVYKSGKASAIMGDVISQLRGCSFIVYGADDPQFEEITKALHDGLPDAKSMGTTGFLFSDNGSISQGITAVGFTDAEVEVYVGTLRKIDTCPIKYLPGLIWTVDQIHRKYKNNICLEFTTGHEERIVSTMKVSLERYGMRLVGGTAGNTAEGQPKKVSYNGKVMTNCVVYAIIGSKMGKIEICKENLYQARPNPHVVTKVSKDCRTIIELDHKKALDVYMEELGYTSSTVEQGVFKNPLSRVVGDENYITAIFSFNKDRSISTYKNLQKNDLICFTDIEDDYQNFIQRHINSVTQGHRVEGIISVNCILRYLLFDQDRYISDYAKLMYSQASGHHMGFVSDGEQYVEQHVNQSMVCAVFTRDM